MERMQHAISIHIRHSTSAKETPPDRRLNAPVADHPGRPSYRNDLAR